MYQDIKVLSRAGVVYRVSDLGNYDGRFIALTGKIGPAFDRVERHPLRDRLLLCSTAGEVRRRICSWGFSSWEAWNWARRFLS
jgi:hypothetical protein